MANAAEEGAKGSRDGARVGGARADFMAQLGRRVAELRQALSTLETELTSARAQGDLKRRIHALASSSRILGFTAMSEQLASVEALLSRGATAGLDHGDVAEIRHVIEGLTSLAWGETGGHSSSMKLAAAEPRFVAQGPASALVVGSSLLADALTTELGAPGDPSLECERTEDPGAALDLARAVAPDVVLLDGDLAGAEALAEKLAEDPLTEPVPLVVVGSFRAPEHAARWLALGVARVLAKPSSPDAIQAACLGAIEGSRRNERAEPLGEMTVDELGARLAEELRRGLNDAASTDARTVKVALGDGHDVLAAVWSAVARVREITTIRSGGVVRFASTGPAGAVPLASFSPEARNPGARGREVGDEARLDGRSVLVVDDDPAVTWFLSGVLRAAGATVLEAHDGDAGLRLAYRGNPDVVISDIVMPGIDGFSLCHAIKRDVALRDVPVILLSWKEDLLQRVRELGASADGYLRKEASGAIVLSRVREVLRPRMRVEARLAAAGEVRGRLDGLTVRTLLSLVGKVRGDARVSVRDASYLYEVELREGAPRRATRTAADGSFDRGAEVLGRMLGAIAGRFVVGAEAGPIRGPLIGTLDEQLRPAIARARAAQKLLEGASLLEVARVQLDDEALAAYFSASPTQTRAIASRLSEGASPRQILLRGGIGARLLEDVLSDAAVHGAVSAVLDASGHDLLPQATADELHAMERGVTRSLLPPPPAEPALAQRSFTEHTPSPLAPLPIPSDGPAPSAQPSPATTPSPLAASPAAADLAPAPPFVQPFLPSPSAEPPQVFAFAAAALAPEPTSAGAEQASAPPAPLLGEPPAPSAPSSPAEPLLLFGAASADPLVAVPAPPVPEPDAAPLASAAPPETLATPSPVQVAARSLLPPVAARAPVAPPTSTKAPPPEPKRAPVVDRCRTGKTVSPPEVRTSEPSPPPPGVVQTMLPRRASGPWGMVALVLAGIGAGVLWFGRDVGHAPPPPAPAVSAPVRAPEPPPPPPPEPATSASAAASTDVPPANGVPFEDLPVPPGEVVPDGQGLLEIVAGRRDEIVVDKLDLGRGPRVKMALPPGTHDVRARRKGEEQPVVVLIKAGRRTRVDLRGPWQR